MSFVVSSCDSKITVDNGLNGLNANMLVKKYGTPARESIVILTKETRLLEYQSNLYTLYPDLSPKDTILVRELFWENKDGSKLAVWLSNRESSWIVVDNLKWAEEVNF
ncbi:MAG: hypothetical protein H7Z75_07095 [Ferruginibacter sp.]|nr:hypothetical protein [Cytophagales bacterium]